MSWNWLEFVLAVREKSGKSKRFFATNYVATLSSKSCTVQNDHGLHCSHSALSRNYCNDLKLFPLSLFYINQRRQWMSSTKQSTVSRIVYISINTLRSRHDGRRRYFQAHFIEWKCMNIPALVQIIVWSRPGEKPLPEPIMVKLLTYVCVTGPQRGIGSRVSLWLNDRLLTLVLHWFVLVRNITLIQTVVKYCAFIILMIDSYL